MANVMLRTSKSIKIDILWIYESFIILLPILDNYKILPVRFTVIAYLFGAILLFFMMRGSGDRHYFDIRHVLLFIFVISMTIMCTLFYGLGGVGYSLPRMGTFVLTFLNFYVFAHKIWDFEKGFELYKKVCVICSVIVIIQFVFGLIGHGFSVMIPGIPTTGDFGLTDGYIRTQLATNRYSSFFLEPAHQSQYTLPCLAILLIGDIEKWGNRKNNIVIALLITGGNFATTSMLGIAGVAIVWLYYIFMLIRNGELNGIARLLVFSPVIIIAVYQFLQQEVLRVQFLKKITSISNGSVVKGTSLYVRLFYGWDCFKSLSPIHKLLGYGYYNSAAFLEKTGIGEKYSSDAFGYLNGISTLFCELGILGAILCLSIIAFPVMKSKNKIAKGILVCWLIVMGTASSYGRMSSLLPITFMLSLVDMENKKRRKELLEH